MRERQLTCLPGLCGNGLYKPAPKLDTGLAGLEKLHGCDVVMVGGYFMGLKEVKEKKILESQAKCPDLRPWLSSHSWFLLRART